MSTDTATTGISSPDYLIIGSGLTGATIGRILHDAGESVLLVDRRNHVGGNVADHAHESGIRIHTYGPHYFRTSSEKVWEYVQRFTEFYPYEAELFTQVGGSLEHWPVVQSYIEETVGTDWEPAFTGEPTNFEEASLSKMPKSIYEAFVKGYTEKQWGVPATSLDSGLAGRFSVHSDGDTRLKRSKYQGIPAEGYTAMMTNMLADLPILIGVDYLKRREEFAPKKLTIFTGPIDEYYGFDLGRLTWRGQQRKHTYKPDVDAEYKAGQINIPSPDDGDHVRVLEWKHMMDPEIAKRISGTVLTTETPFTPDSPEAFEYPFPDQANKDLYQQYRDRADAEEAVLICGRLGEYKYYDMDQAISRAMGLATRILNPDAVVDDGLDAANEHATTGENEAK